MGVKSKIKEYNFITWGGLGDTLLMTPIFKYLSLQGNIVNVLASNKKYYDVLFNNPFINYLKLEEIDFNNFDQSKYIRPCYSNLFPSLFFENTNASKLMGQMIGLEINEAKPVIQLTHEEINEVDIFIETNNLSNLITINPYTDDNPNKEWLDENWIDLVSKLNANGYSIVQLGREGHPKIKGIDFNIPFSIRFSIGLIYRSTVFIGIDSFLNHVTAALNTNAIILFVPTIPAVYGHENCEVISNNQKCSPCDEILGKIKCPFDKQCMRLITVEDVLKLLYKL